MAEPSTSEQSSSSPTLSFNAGKFTDWHVDVEDSAFTVHIHQLASNSGYFDALFSSHMNEALQRRSVLAEFPGGAESFLAILRWIYRSTPRIDCPSWIPSDLGFLLTVWAGADRLQMDSGFKEEIIELLRSKYLSDVTSAAVLSDALRYQCDTAVDLCVKLMQERLGDLIAYDFNFAPPEIIAKVLTGRASTIPSSVLWKFLRKYLDETNLSNVQMETLMGLAGDASLDDAYWLLMKGTSVKSEIVMAQGSKLLADCLYASPNDISLLKGLTKEQLHAILQFPAAHAVSADAAFDLISEFLKSIEEPTERQATADYLWPVVNLEYLSPAYIRLCSKRKDIPLETRMEAMAGALARHSVQHTPTVEHETLVRSVERLNNAVTYLVSNMKHEPNIYRGWQESSQVTAAASFFTADNAIELLRGTPTNLLHFDNYAGMGWVKFDLREDPQEFVETRMRGGNGSAWYIQWSDDDVTYTQCGDSGLSKGQEWVITPLTRSGKHRYWKYMMYQNTALPWYTQFAWIPHTDDVPLLSDLTSSWKPTQSEVARKLVDIQKCTEMLAHSSIDQLAHKIRQGPALHINAPGSGIQIPDDGSLNPSVFTLSVWAYTPVSNDKMLLIDKCDAGMGLGFQLWSNSFKYSVGGGRMIDQDFVMGTHGEWHHIAVTFSSTHVRIYLDGEESNCQELDPTQNQIVYTNNPLTIGTDTGLTVGGETGFIMSDVRIWDSPLSQEQIREGMFSSPDMNDPSLVLYLPFSDMSLRKSGDSIPDYSGTGNAGTLVGVVEVNLPQLKVPPIPWSMK